MASICVQVLKDDPKAFAGMVLDLHGATLANLQEIQQYLPKLAHREDVERVLQRMEELVRDELGELRAVLQQFVNNNKPKLSQLPLYRCHLL
ncbi:hypothetical protein J0895_24930 [Phormidium pseudopriestleyi FRX01]|uniref:Uncharacterized protein n=1 Tax=Phormidium pseudopriestleyi FRX01 TaxID=1759528 RepID=A0ABS3FZW4_9CYAN|nr:hypothetical protein [Phormidium pseudopriestleyi]MBO0352268.1 hypothetical protein [Phormidium pseudopriestleyi FRX01]